MLKVYSIWYVRIRKIGMRAWQRRLGMFRLYLKNWERWWLWELRQFVLLNLTLEWLPLVCKGFVSSNHIYSAVVYWRIKTAVRDRVRYISGKTKVVPLEFLSILHLELLGCVLQNKFINEVCSAVSSRLLIHNKFCWADSEVVLCWIMGNEKSWKQWV